jgi:hypothetical protein
MVVVNLRLFGAAIDRSAHQIARFRGPLLELDPWLGADRGSLVVKDF